MNSLKDLNTYSQTLVEYTDNRPAAIIFDRTLPVDQILSINEGQDHNVPVGINILEIINYDQVSAYYIVNVSSMTGATVTWPVIPAGCTVTNPSPGMYKIDGIVSAAIWDQIASPKISVPGNFTGTYQYTAQIVGTTTTKTWAVTLTIVDITVLTLATDFSYTSGTQQTITGSPRVISTGAYANASWTITIKPVDYTTPVSSMTALGYATWNSGTKTLTITGTTEQINTLSLPSLKVTFADGEDYSFRLEYKAVVTGTNETDYKYQNLSSNNYTRLGQVRGQEYYSVNTTVDIINGPFITDTSYAGTGYYQMQVKPNDLSALGTLSTSSIPAAFTESQSIANTQEASSINISLDGLTMAVGYPSEGYVEGSDNFGYVYIYTRSLSTNTWTQTARFRPSQTTSAYSGFGQVVKLSADGLKLFVKAGGAPAGKIFVYTTTNKTTWTLSQEIDPPVAFDYRSMTVSDDGITLVVAGDYDPVGSPNTQPILTYQLELGSYVLKSETARVTKSGTAWDIAISQDGLILVVGYMFAITSGTSIEEGNVHIYTRSSIADNWSLVQILTPYRETNEFSQYVKSEFGASVSIDAVGKYISVGAPNQYNSGTGGHGRVYVYKKTGTNTWSLVTNLYYSNSSYSGTFGSIGRFGSSTRLSRDGITLAVANNFVDVDAQSRIHIYNRTETTNFSWYSSLDFDGALYTYAYSNDQGFDMSGNKLSLVTRKSTSGNVRSLVAYSASISTDYNSTTKTLTFTGTRTGINNAIESIKYTPATGYSASSFDLIYKVITPGGTNSSRNQKVTKQ